MGNAIARIGPNLSNRTLDANPPQLLTSSLEKAETKSRQSTRMTSQRRNEPAPLLWF